MYKKTTEAPGPTGSLQKAPASNHLNIYKTDMVKKKCEEKAHITFTGRVFHILPAVYAKEFSKSIKHCKLKWLIS